MPFLPFTAHVLHMVPQMRLCGDALVSPQGNEFVVSCLADGRRLGTFSHPNPDLSSTPVQVRDRLYSFGPELLLEYSLTTGSSTSTHLSSFIASEDAVPVALCSEASDFIVMPGRDRLVLIDVRNGKPHFLEWHLSEGDSVHSPVVWPGFGIVFTTRLGDLFALRINGDRWAEKVQRFNIRQPAKRYFSAPSFNPSTNCVYMECVDRRDTPALGITLRLGRDDGKIETKRQSLEESPAFNENISLPLLAFPPLVCGQYGMVRSLDSDDQCHFFSYNMVKTVQIRELAMDPVATVSEGNSIVSVQGHRVQCFQASPVDQTATVCMLPRGPSDDDVAVNRPVCALGKIFIQHNTKLFGWEIA